MPWSKADLQPKIETRARELGKTLSEVLPAGYPGTTFFSESKRGSPTIRILEEIAGKLNWTLCELLCESRPAFSEGLLKLAVEIAQRALPDRPDLRPDATVSAYDVLTETEDAREPIDQSAISTLVRTLRGKYRGQ